MELRNWTTDILAWGVLYHVISLYHYRLWTSNCSEQNNFECSLRLFMFKFEPPVVLGKLLPLRNPKYRTVLTRRIQRAYSCVITSRSADWQLRLVLAQVFFDRHRGFPFVNNGSISKGVIFVGGHSMASHGWDNLEAEYFRGIFCTEKITGEI